MSNIVRKGSLFHAVYADSNAQWRVEKARGGSAYECVIIDNPDYNGVRRVFGKEEILASKRRDSLYAALGKSQKGFWQSRQIGEILHYDNGFGDFVRGVVVREDGEMKLQPIALVGEWRQHALPKRLLNGEIDLGYHAGKIVAKNGAWQPSESCVFEAPAYSRRKGDPRKLQPISLEVPPMDEEKAELARVENIRQKMVAALQGDRIDRNDLRNSIYSLIKEAGELALAA